MKYGGAKFPKPTRSGVIVGRPLGRCTRNTENIRSAQVVFIRCYSVVIVTSYFASATQSTKIRLSRDGSLLGVSGDYF